MSLSGRIGELHTKHRELEHVITQEQKRPHVDSLKIKALKRQKLKIKEELRGLDAG
jgi:hypothetical protein